MTWGRGPSWGRPMPVARAVVVDHLPEGRAVAAVHSDGESVILLAKDRKAEEYAAELSEVMQDGIVAGLWLQQWSGPDRPPQLRQAG